VNTAPPPPWRPVGRTAPRIFERFPALRERLPFLALAHLPTPVTRLHALADYLGRDDVWMKRDDLTSPLYGGNKVRRYEFVLADAIARRAPEVLTAGGLASTQVMATARFCEALRLPLTAVLFDQRVTRFAQGALRVNARAGATLIRGGGYVGTTLRVLWELARRRGAYLVMPGASHALANLGYVDAMLELAAQVDEGLLPRPDVIVVPTGSAGTLAALSLGAAHLGWNTEVVGARIATRLVTNDHTVRGRIRATAGFLARRGADLALAAEPRWSLDHGVIGGGYGEPTAESVANIPRVRAVLGVDGEVTYSAKALACLRRVAQDPRWKGKTVLAWQTLSSTPMPDAGGEDALSPRLRALLDAPTPC
jgi:D-cysteine desulfhydrase